VRGRASQALDPGGFSNTVTFCRANAAGRIRQLRSKALVRQFADYSIATVGTRLKWGHTGVQNARRIAATPGPPDRLYCAEPQTGRKAANGP
jgi:hypothetical protein